MGGMAAFIPSRRDEDVNRKAFAKVREDKERESRAGHDGTWVAHPDLVALADEVFTDALDGHPNQIQRRRDDVEVSAADLLDFSIPDGTITAQGVRQNIDVAIRYIAAWLRGNGAAAIYNLMEDAATAEISRSQIWQWVRYAARTTEGETVTTEMVQRIAAEELERIRLERGEQAYGNERYDEARELFEAVALADEFPEFLTVPAYEHLF